MGNSKELGEVVIGGTWIFLSSISLSLTGFIFWIIVSRIVGVGAVGSTSAAISAAGVATTLIAAGLPLASLREFAASGPKALKPALTVALTLGVPAALAAYFLSARIPKAFGIPGWFASILAFLTICSSLLTRALIGLGFFKNYFITSLISSIVKLLLAVSLAIIGVKLLAPLMGYLAFPVIAMAIATYYIISSKGLYHGGSNDYVTSPASFIKLAYSNYPFAFSSQLLNMLSVYFFATLTSESVTTGTLYMDLMIMLVIASINGSILNASLSVGVRKSVDPFVNALNTGLVLSVPIASIAGVISAQILWVINPQLIKGAQTLTTLTLAIPALAAVTASIAKLNKERRLKEITVIGGVRLATLIITLPLLARIAGTEGVALSYLLANTVPLVFAIRHIPDSLESLATLWSIQAITYLCKSVSSTYLEGKAATALSLTVLFVLMVIYVIKRRDRVAQILSVLRSLFKAVIR